MTQPPGWYPANDMAGTLRYWDGADWTDKVAPMQGKPTKTQWQARRAALIAFVTVLVLAAGALAYGVIHANDDAECAIRNADRALGQRLSPYEDCD